MFVIIFYKSMNLSSLAKISEILRMCISFDKKKNSLKLGEYKKTFTGKESVGESVHKLYRNNII